MTVIGDAASSTNVFIKDDTTCGRDPSRRACIRPSTSTSWYLKNAMPLPLSDRAREAARARSEALFAETEKAPARSIEKAVLFAHLSLVDDDSRWAPCAVRHLNAGIDSADELCATGRWGLYGGLAGLGWAVERVSRILGANTSDDLNKDTDAALLRELQRGRWWGSCDLESGLAGIGVYFVERIPARSAIAGVKLVVDHMESMAGQDWPRPWPSGAEFDVAGGLPGMMHVLAEAVAAGIQAEVPVGLIERAADWLRTHHAPSHPLAWRRDLGTAAIAFRCARITGRGEDREFAERILDRCLAVSPADSAITTASVRDGSAGIAQTFHLIYRSEGDPRCLERAQAWFERTLAILQGRESASNSGGDCFLDGDVGVVLALLSAATTGHAEWDQRLALSGRSLRCK